MKEDKQFSLINKLVIYVYAERRRNMVVFNRLTRNERLGERREEKRREKNGKRRYVFTIYGNTSNSPTHEMIFQNLINDY